MVMLACEVGFVLGWLLILATVIAMCRWAVEADDQQDRYLTDPLECKYAAPACESRSHYRGAVR